MSDRTTPPAGAGSTPRVLVVDDSLTVRMDLAEALSTAGFDATACGSLAEARAELTRSAYDAVILDVMLPDGDGIDLLAEIRRAPGALASTPVMMLSSEAEVADRIRAARTGADAYAGKPYDHSWVVARTRELVAARGRSAAPARRPIILVIEASPTHREALKSALEAAGYAVVTAATGEAGLDTAAVVRPAAIVVDGVLPGIDGASVIRRIRMDAALRDTPCMLLTGSDDATGELVAFEAGADAYVRKGTDAAVIVARVGALARSERPVPEGQSVLGPKSVLLVSAEPARLDQLAADLRRGHFDVAAARSIDDARDLFAVQGADCVVIDATEGVTAAADACRALRDVANERRAALLVLCSKPSSEGAAELEAELAVACLAAGADDVVPCGLDPALLRARIRAQLRRKQVEDESRRLHEERLRRDFEVAEARAARELADLRAALLAEVERKNAELEAANAELEAFSYSVSHDLRAPLRAILGFTRVLLEDHLDALDERGRDYLTRVHAAAERMSALIDDLLQLSRIGRAPLRRKRVDLSALVRAIVDDLRAREPSRDVELRIAEGVVAEADPGLVRAALENLLANAWKFTAKKERAVIEFGVLDRDEGPTYYVKDDGVGSTWPTRRTSSAPSIGCTIRCSRARASGSRRCTASSRGTAAAPGPRARSIEARPSTSRWASGPSGDAGSRRALERAIAPPTSLSGKAHRTRGNARPPSGRSSRKTLPTACPTAGSA